MLYKYYFRTHLSPRKKTAKELLTLFPCWSLKSPMNPGKVTRYVASCFWLKSGQLKSHHIWWLICHVNTGWVGKDVLPTHLYSLHFCCRPKMMTCKCHWFSKTKEIHTFIERTNWIWHTCESFLPTEVVCRRRSSAGWSGVRLRSCDCSTGCWSSRSCCSSGGHWWLRYRFIWQRCLLQLALY